MGRLHGHLSNVTGAEVLEVLDSYQGARETGNKPSSTHGHSSGMCSEKLGKIRSTNAEKEEHEGCFAPRLGLSMAGGTEGPGLLRELVSAVAYGSICVVQERVRVSSP